MKVKFEKKRLLEARNLKGIKSNDALIDDGYRFEVKSRQFDNYMKNQEMPFEKLLLIARFLNVSTDYLCGYVGNDNEAEKFPFTDYSVVSFQVSKSKLKDALKQKITFHNAIYGPMDAWLESCGIPKTELKNLEMKSFRKPNENKIYPYEELRGRLYEATLKIYNDVIVELGLDDIRVK